MKGYKEEELWKGNPLNMYYILVRAYGYLDIYLMSLHCVFPIMLEGRT